MEKQFDNTNTGALFKNNQMREGKKDPEYNGTINIDGKEYWLSGWVKASKKDGAKYFSLTVKPKQSDGGYRPKAASRPAPTAPAASGRDTWDKEKEDDELPF